jgi:spore maturation protein CgeB
MRALQGNLDALRGTDAELAARIAGCGPSPSVASFPAQSGAWSFRVDGRLQTSARDPEVEARRFAEQVIERADSLGARRLVLFGLLPYALPALAARFETLLIVEPSLELVRAALERIDLSPWLPRARLLAGEAGAACTAHPALSGPDLGLIECHAPARRRAPELCERVARAFRGGTPVRALDIALIPPCHGGSLPVARACARALRELGHRVREYDLEPLAPALATLTHLAADLALAPLREELRAGWTRLASRALVESLRLDPPDLVFALAQAPLDAPALRALRARDVPTALWFCEDFRVMTWWRELAPLYDVVFHLQPQSFAAPLAASGAHGVPLPMAFDPGVHRPLELDPGDRARYGADFSFVGAAYHNRVCFLPGLFDLGLRVYGVGWPQTPAWRAAQPEPAVRQPPDLCNRIFNASAINLNLHSSPWVDGVNPSGDYLNPRSFELAGAGAFQLVDEREDLARSFAPDEIQTFRDLDGCRLKVRHFLLRPDERREISERARRRALAEHTYRHRMEEAVDRLRSAPRPVGARARACRVAGEVREQARELAPELVPLLERLAPDRSLDADALRELIARGEGPLAPAEKRLLFMREAAAEAVFTPGGAR